MTSRAIILLHLFLGALACFAQQAPPIEWEYTWGGSDGDAAYATDLAVDGSVFLGGRALSNDGDVNGAPDVWGDAWVVKMAQGVIIWQRVLGGSETDYVNAVRATDDGGCIVAGSTNSDNGAFTGNHGENDWWVAKLDANGATEWSRMLGGTSWDTAEGLDLCSDGGCVVVGYTDSEDGDVVGDQGGQDVWVVRLDANGELLWQRPLGGAQSDSGSSVQQTADGGFLVSGGSMSSDGQVSGNHGGTDGWVARLDGDGQILWQLSIGGTEEDIANAVHECADEGILVSGQTWSSDGDFTLNHGGYDAWIVRLNHRGEIQWARTLGGAMEDRAYAVAQTTDGRFAVAGMTRSDNGDVSGNHGERDMWVVKLDTNGTVLWQKPMGGTQGEEARAMVSSPDGGLIVAGFAVSTDGDVAQGNGYTDMWALKLAPDVVGIEEETTGAIGVFCGNDGDLIVRSRQPLGEAAITVSDAMGRIIRRDSFSGASHRIASSDLAHGVYLIWVSAGPISMVRRVVMP